MKKCWYCAKKYRNITKENPDALFCKDCEKINKKKVDRAEIENFYQKI